MRNSPARASRRLALDAFVPYRLSVLTNQVSSAIARHYADRFGLTIPEWRVMAVLGDTPGSPLWPGEASGELTERQREVVQLVAEGHAVKEIAAILNISRKTVAFHKSNVMRRLGVRSTAELTKYALEHGLIGS